MCQQFNLAGRHFGISGAFRANSQLAVYPQHEFIAQGFGLGKHGSIVRIEHDLQQPLFIAQIDKNDPAMVAAAINPATNGNACA